MIRIGLTGVALGLVALLITETQFEGAYSGFVVRVVAVSAALVALGIVVQLFRRGARAAARPRCGRCGRRIAKGDVYCAEHLPGAGAPGLTDWRGLGSH